MRHAFTLIEVLVVITIISLLTGMMIIGSSAMMKNAKSQKTSAILTIVLQGLELQRMERGGALAPAEHPLAGSAEPRFIFTRGATALATAGLALTGVPAVNLPAAFQPRLMLPDDRFADPRVPALFGVRRSDLGVLGASLKEVQKYRRLPLPSVATAVIANPDDIVAYPNLDCLVSSLATPGDSSQAVQFALNRGNALTELQKLGALSEADESKGVSGAGGRVWIPPEAAGASSAWKGSTFTNPDTSSRSGYRLRGIAIYDAWGREILYSLTGNGVICLTSSGPDGFFRVNPGHNATIETAADATTFSGDDLDAGHDNVQLVAGGDLK